MLIDSHCHLSDPRLKENIKEIISEAKRIGVVKFVNIGTSILNDKNSVKLANEYEEVYTSVGVYPHEDKDLQVSQMSEELQKLINGSKRIVAVGECGIDNVEGKGEREIKDQEKIFLMQLELAVKNDLPVVIHNRGGDEIIFSLLNGYKNKIRGVAHCFSSDWETAKKYLELGFYLSFSGILTYPSAKDLTDVLKKVPDDRFVFETDAPYLPPQGHRGEVNKPEYVRIVAEKASQIKEKPFADVCRLSYDNTCRLFNL
jgi:TatD DNase family protein